MWVGIQERAGADLGTDAAVDPKWMHAACSKRSISLHFVLLVQPKSHMIHRLIAELPKWSTRREPGVLVPTSHHRAALLKNKHQVTEGCATGYFCARLGCDKINPECEWEVLRAADHRPSR